MPTNDFQPFATATGANVLTPTAYAALAARLTGFVSGIAQSQQLNTVWRQSSVVAAMIAKFIVDQTGGDVLDDGDVTALETKFVAALDALISPELYALSVAMEAAISHEADLRAAADNLLAPITSPALNGTPTAPTPTTGDNTTKLATTAFVKTAIDAIPSVVAPQAGSQAADISTGSTPSVTSYTFSTLPVAGLLHVTAFFNSGGVASYNFHSTLAVTATGETDQSLTTDSVISHGHTMCIPVAAGASPVVSLSVTSDNPSAGQVRLSYLYIPI